MRGPELASGDDAFDGKKQRKVRIFLELQNIWMRRKTVRRHNKLGIVVRKHATVNIILERLKYDRPEASDATILFRAILFSNCFCGKQMLSEFQLVEG